MLLFNDALSEALFQGIFANNVSSPILKAKWLCWFTSVAGWKHQHCLQANLTASEDSEWHEVPWWDSHFLHDTSHLNERTPSHLLIQMQGYSQKDPWSGKGFHEWKEEDLQILTFCCLFWIVPHSLEQVWFWESQSHLWKLSHRKATAKSEYLSKRTSLGQCCLVCVRTKKSSCTEEILNVWYLPWKYATETSFCWLHLQNILNLIAHLIYTTKI